MITDKEKKAIERIEDFLTTNIIISISNDETANSEELKAFISKNEYLSIEFISAMFLKQSKEIEELKEKNKNLEDELNKYIVKMSDEEYRRLVDIIIDETSKDWKNKIKAKIEEIDEVLKGQLIEKIRVYFEAQKEVLQSLLEKE